MNEGPENIFSGPILGNMTGKKNRRVAESEGVVRSPRTGRLHKLQPDSWSWSSLRGHDGMKHGGWTHSDKGLGVSLCLVFSLSLKSRYHKNDRIQNNLQLEWREIHFKDSLKGKLLSQKHKLSVRDWEGIKEVMKMRAQKQTAVQNMVYTSLVEIFTQLVSAAAWTLYSLIRRMKAGEIWSLHIYDVCGPINFDCLKQKIERWDERLQQTPETHCLLRA